MYTLGMEMPDWPKLWEREPGLKPPDFTWPFHLETRALAMLDYVLAPVEDEVAAALCRDAATSFLKAWYKDALPSDTVWPLGLQVHAALVRGSDVDLYAACEAVLNARH
jgi:hypothetical protein